ncbi:hypothetical protein P5673_019255 [Acropora cervicornis]|uniref:Uncharacterized protein n=1 Tax=Acropora cervicornis TaxID=6130 RepID=A0AAD9QCU8_ACRCE|nr:hypothetical protein P5673_019255 [Acropora cervicornis]
MFATLVTLVFGQFWSEDLTRNMSTLASTSGKGELGTISEPEYVTNLTKFFNDTYYTGTFYKKVTSKEKLESEAKEILLEYLRDKYKDINRFFNEWKMTFLSDGPFETQEDLNAIKQKMTNPDDFMTELYIQDMLTNRDDEKEASGAYVDAFVSKDNVRVALFYLGDDDIMHGVLAAGVRSNMDAVFVVFLTD